MLVTAAEPARNRKENILQNTESEKRRRQITNNEYY